MFWAVEATPGRTHPPTEALEALPTERLEHEIAELAAHLSAGTCRWLELVAEFDRREGWGSWRCRSCAEWIAWQCSVAPRAAREHVRVARALGELPRIHEAFARGELSYSKVRALTRVAAPDSEEELLELSRHATAAQLERIVRGLRSVSADEAERAYLERYLVHYWEDDGSLCVHARIPAEDGALVLEAVEAARDALWVERRASEGGSAEPRDLDPGTEGGSAEPQTLDAGLEGGPAEPHRPPGPGPTKADALVAMAEGSLAAGPARRSGGDRYQVVLHVDPSGQSPPALEDGPAVSEPTARRIARDASVVAMTESAGKPLTVGRKRRTIPPSMRRALEARGRRCAFPGCEQARFIDAHHIRHWADGGETRIDNLILLCRHHHRAVHEGGFAVAHGSDGTARFRARDGTRISDLPAVVRGDPAAVVRANGRAGLEVGAQTWAAGTGEPMDLDHVVAVAAAKLA